MSISSSPILSVFLTPLLVITPIWPQTPAMQSVQDLQLQIVDSDGPQVQTSSRTAKGFTIVVTDSTGSGVPDVAVVFRLPDSGPTGSFSDGSHAAVMYTDRDGRAGATGIQWSDTPGPFAMRITASKGTNHAGILVQETLIPGMAMAPNGPAVLPIAAMSVPPPPPVLNPGTLRSSDSKAQLATASTSKAAPSVQQTATATADPSITASANKPEPSVSVSSASPGVSQHSGKAKWLIIAAIAAGAGAGIALAGKGKSSTSAATGSGVSIGTPSISVGHP